MLGENSDTGQAAGLEHMRLLAVDVGAVKDRLSALERKVNAGTAPGSIPIGGIFDWPALVSALPAWAHVADGSILNIADWPLGFAAFATTYGGDGVTTFGIPDRRGRVSVGLDNMGGSDAGRLSVANTLGGTGGVESANIALTEIPDHSHQPGNGGTGAAGVGGTGDNVARSNGSPDASFRTGAGIFASASYGSAARGGQTALSKMQPYQLTNIAVRLA